LLLLTQAFAFKDSFKLNPLLIKLNSNSVGYV
jgi:hypothetical protein